MGWVEFVAANATDFGQEFEQKPLARPGTKLADNIERTLNLLADYPDVIRHVVLAFYQEERHAPQSVAECGLKFQVVGMTCDSINTAGMFYMPP
jgi:hypothetical protein